MRYLPHTEEDCRAMLEAVGLTSMEQLFESVPAELRLGRGLELPPPLSEQELLVHLEEISSGNAHGGTLKVFLGAGAYDHFIPSVVDHLAGRSEFYTAYTPYQPELSQGTLQSIFEFQSLICQLTGMEVANASLYEGATAVAEAALMAWRVKKGGRVAVSRALHPHYRRVLSTYLAPLGAELVEVPFDEGGHTEREGWGNALGEGVAAAIVQSPNFFGLVEDLKTLGEAARAGGVLFIVAVTEALSLALLKPPGELGADVVAGEGQSFGLPLSFGGPYLGLFATREKFMRQMPGRLVGETVDSQRRRGFVLALATREQHIRRERATSNICTNEGLCALRATIYLSALGKEGLRKLALLNLQRAAYARELLSDLPGFSVPFLGPIFNEFVLTSPLDPERLFHWLLEQGVVGGYPLSRHYPELKGESLFCITELNGREDIEHMAELLSRAARGGIS